MSRWIKVSLKFIAFNCKGLQRQKSSGSVTLVLRERNETSDSLLFEFLSSKITIIVMKWPTDFYYWEEIDEKENYSSKNMIHRFLQTRVCAYVCVFDCVWVGGWVFCLWLMCAPLSWNTLWYTSAKYTGNALQAVHVHTQTQNHL